MAAVPDIDNQVAVFGALGSKQKMREFLIKINEDNNLAGRDKVNITGSIAVLKGNYRNYLGRVAGIALPGAKQSGESTSAKKKKTTQSEPAPRSSPNPESAARQTDGLVTSLVVPRHAKVSRTTMDCLQRLDSPVRKLCTLKSKTNDISPALGPLDEIVSAWLLARETTNQKLSHDFARNLERLRLEMRRSLPTLEAATIWSTFCKAWGVDVESQAAARLDTQEENAVAMAEQSSLATSGRSSHEDHDMAVSEQSPSGDKLILAEMRIVWDSLNRATSDWFETFPDPPAEHIAYPLDFSTDEKIDLRNHARVYVKDREHLQPKDASQEDLAEAAQGLLEDWPLSKGKFVSIATAILKEARSNLHKNQDRSRSRSLAGSVESEQSVSRAGSADENDSLFDHSMAETPSMSATLQKPSRKRNIYCVSEFDEDDDEGSIEAMNVTRKRPYDAMRDRSHEQEDEAEFQRKRQQRLANFRREIHGRDSGMTGLGGKDAHETQKEKRKTRSHEVYGMAVDDQDYEDHQEMTDAYEARKTKRVTRSHSQDVFGMAAAGEEDGGDQEMTDNFSADHSRGQRGQAANRGGRGRSRTPRAATAAQSGRSRHTSPVKVAAGDVSLESIEEVEEE